MIKPSNAEVKPILLFNDECAVCRSIARWVGRSAASKEGGAPTIVEKPIGDDPDALLLLNPDLDIWDAYETIHLLMPDGSMKTGGEAVAEVLRRLPNCTWFSGAFELDAFGRRPFQSLLNLGYLILSDARPLFGCESCGTLSPWVKAVHSVVHVFDVHPKKATRAKTIPHFTVRRDRPVDVSSRPAAILH